MQIPSTIPETMRALVLSGTGFDHLALETVPVPRPGPRQLLARVDAAGVCTSLIKIVEQGGAHRHLAGWDPARHPLILGDEGSVTLVQVGEELQETYRPGERYVIQPAVDHPPIHHRERYTDNARGLNKVSVGYTLPGHLAEYILIPEEVLEGRCLLPYDPALPYAHAAIAEPFSCVISGQDHQLHLKQEDGMAPREAYRGLTPGGTTLILGLGAMGRMQVDLALSYAPRLLIAVDVLDERLDKVRDLYAERAKARGVELVLVNSTREDLQALLLDRTGDRGADDVIVAVGSAEVIEQSQYYVAHGGGLNLFGGLKRGEDVLPFDTGIVHYREIVITGNSGGSPWDVTRTLELMKDGAIDPASHITRVADLDHAIDIIREIQARTIDGKAVIYPHRRIQAMQSVPRWTAEDESAYLASTE